MTENERFLIYPWNMSVTGGWPLEGLHGLRDEDPEKIAQIFLSDDVEDIYVSAMSEYFSHGYIRKAAEVTRVLVEKDPSIKELINRRLSDSVVEELLETKLENLPGKPSEFSKYIRLEYVQ